MPAPRKFVRAEFYDTLEVDMNYDGLRAPGEIQAAGKPAESCYATMYYDGRFKLSVYHGIQFRRVGTTGKQIRRNSTIYGMTRIIRMSNKP